MLGSSLGGPGTAGPYFSFSDGTASRIRSDFNRVRSDLYTENRLIPFQTWAHAYNMKLRLSRGRAGYVDRRPAADIGGARSVGVRVADRQ
jgi:hypothetical protein